MKNVDIYNAAIAIAQASVGQPNQVAFEKALGDKGVELGMALNEFNQFCTDARNVRSKFAQYQKQDDQAAAAEAARVANANAPKPAISPATGLPYVAAAPLAIVKPAGPEAGAPIAAPVVPPVLPNPS